MHTKTILGWSQLRRKAMRKRAWRVLSTVVGVSTIINVSAIGALIAPRAAVAAFGSGAIWTTNETCANPAAQDDNEYAIGETVHVRGENFDPEVTLHYQVKGQPGQASADPNVVVASGPTSTDVDGYFCVAAYVVAGDDDGTYTVDVYDNPDFTGQKKNDNYHVNGVTFGTLTVHKQADTDGDGTYDITVTDLEGGFQWQLSDEDAWNTFGTSKEINPGAYQVWENNVSGYHFVGWRFGQPDGDICSDAELSDNSTADFEIDSGQDVHITFCNAIDTYNVEVRKVVDPLYGGPSTLPSEHPWTWSTGSITKHSQESATLFAGSNNVITETPDWFQAPDWQASWSCIRLVGEGSFEVGSGQGRSFDPQTDFSAAPEHGQSYVCEFWNTELGGLHGQKWNDLNGNGIWDSGEPALNGWTVYLDNNDNGQKDDGEPSMVTQNHDDGIPANDDNGWYWFEGLESGTYKICEVQQGGWNQTYPTNSNDNCHTMHVGFASQDVASTCYNPITLELDLVQNAILAPSCNFGNQVVPVTTITLDKTGPATANPGNQITYNLAWTVAGNTSATNAVVTDPIPANTSFVSATNSGTFAAGVVTWNLGTQAPGASGTVSVTVTVAASLTTATTLVNTGTFDTDQTPPVSDTVNTSVVIPQVLAAKAPNLSITKSADVKVVNPSQPVNYTLVVTSTGEGTATNVVVTDTLPAGMTFADGSGTTKTWNLGTMLPGTQQFLTYKVNVSAGAKAGDYVNTATVKGDDVDPRSASATVQVRIPQVLGLATTGAGFRDYAIFTLGLSLIAAGYVMARRNRRAGEVQA